MKLICTTGSISCDKVLANKGDIFEVGDKAGESLIASGDATEVGIELEEVVGSERLDGNITSDTSAHPTISWTIPDIKAWLDAANIEYPDRAVKAELISLIGQGE